MGIYWFLERKISSGFALALLVLGLVGATSLWSMTRLIKSVEQSRSIDQVLGSLQSLLSQLQDAETGQRGYLLTGSDRYLEPYETALAQIPQQQQLLRQLLRDHPQEQAILRVLDPLIESKLAELAETIQQREQAGLEAAIAIVLTEQGRQMMDAIRQGIHEMNQGIQQKEQRLEKQIADQTHFSMGILVLIGGIACIFLPIASWVTQRELKIRQQIQQSLVLSEERYRRLIDTASEGICILDNEGKIRLVNQKMSDLLGYPADQMLDHHLLDFVAVEAQPLIKDYLQADSQDLTQHRDLQLHGQDQQERWVMLSMNSLDTPDPTQTGSTSKLVMLTDITERKLVESALQEVSTQLSDWVGDLEARNNALSRLREMSNLLQTCLHISDAYQVIAQTVPSLFPDIPGMLCKLNASKNLLESVATWGSPLSSQAVFAASDCWGLRRGEPHWVADPSTGLRCSHLEEPWPAHSFCLPLLAQGETLGVLYFAPAQKGQFNQTSQLLAETLAEQIGLALGNLQLRETLRNQSIRDPLTGLFNRRYLEESLEREINRATRSQKPLALIMVDVDHFKHFNDTFGHDAGDLVLQALGRFLQESVRGGDIACRLGGEEMILMLPEADLPLAEQRAEQIRLGIQQISLHHQQQLLDPITASLGVAVFPQHGLTQTALLKSADTALYEAKAQGRNCVVVAS
ncbi:MAG: diguanylate cyclase [Cyanobacteriota bacterium]|nr:diguanylate cyclase [Cyanobacteriota bacterium]